VRPLPWCRGDGVVPAMVVLAFLVLVSGNPPWADVAEKPADAPASVSAQDAAPQTSPGGAEQPAENKPAEPEKKGAGKPWVRGSFEAGFDGIWAEEASDLNLDQFLRLKVDPPQCPRLHVRGALWMHEDLNSDEAPYSVLRDINDAWDSAVRARLLYLYADIDSLWKDSTLRIGRQRITEGAAFNRIDGIYLKQRFPGWDWYVFGGVRASLYSDPHDDLVTGGGASARVTERTRVALDMYYGEDDRGSRSSLYRFLEPEGFVRPLNEDLKDAAVALSVWQTVTPNLMVFGRFTGHDGGGHEVLLNATGSVPAWDLMYEVSYRRQLNTFGDRVNDLTGFYRVLGPAKAHDHYFFALHKPLTKKLMVSMEGEIHNANGSDWRTANRDYQRLAAILSAEKVCNSVDAQVGLERWNVEGGAGTWAVTGEVTKHWSKLSVTLGADYQRYEDRVILFDAAANRMSGLEKIIARPTFDGFTPTVFLSDTLAVQLHQNIHSIYAKTKWAVNTNQDLTVKVTYENEEATDGAPESPYWRVKAEYAIRF